MSLFSQKMGLGRPLLILHGLFGMSNNWLTIGKRLAKNGFAVHLLDIRNHGRSPHTSTHTYQRMCDDLLDYLEQEKISEVNLAGHSMGGKIGMYFGLLHPEKLNNLVVIDIAPVDYRQHNPTHHSTIIKHLMEIDLAAGQNRQAIVEEVERRLGDRALAGFLGKSIMRDNQGNFKWMLNLPVLLKHLPDISTGLEALDLHAPSSVRTLFIRGARSDYIRPEHEPDRMKYFPQSKMATIDNAGHWLHVEQPEKLVSAISTFISELG